MFPARQLVIQGFATRQRISLSLSTHTNPHPQATYIKIITRRPRRATKQRQQAVMANGRSVKSIVAWLESPKESNFPPTTTRSSSSGNVGRNPSWAECQARAGGGSGISLSRSGEVEDGDDSLTTLNYRSFFGQKPLGRCLDGVEEDLSKLSIEDVIARSGKTDRAVVSIDRGEKAVGNAVPKREAAKAIVASATAEDGRRPSAHGGEASVAQQSARRSGLTSNAGGQPRGGAVVKGGKG
ncbi:hypothetical protein L249_5095 [Ophiocordyceps polyrhachis-furcata BCC 54312]|uniref:Uncharacterized protein n=1 Tax=Ophiocordyceps polyrhachis-furcata BCC 54312 TaxID=1330021 RepID=A0A367L3L5_9HYPO|nr:hypothetical protein L249_5095 [Ophiocordyceps polyrhachis-furcata BCC 54312]